MECKFFYNISNILIGVLLGFSITYIFQQKEKIIKKNKQIVIEEKYELIHQELIKEQKIRENLERQIKDYLRELCELHICLASSEEKLSVFADLKNKYDELNKELCKQQEINNNQQLKLKEIITRSEEINISEKQKQDILINSEKRLSFQFENLANRIFEQNIRQVNKKNNQSLNNLLLPLREQLDIFRRQIQDNFNQEAKERHTLKYEINNLQKLNSQITQETINLTRALKGDNKIQGNWGEVILSKVLENSGLRKDHEYTTQVGIKNDDGRKAYPDVIIHLPKNKDVIIDAKVSLLSYEKLFNCDSSNKIDRQIALDDYLNSLRTHIKLLGQKKYHQLPNIRSLDYILMFISIESAFILAINQYPELMYEALSYNIMLVSPSTLMVVLRTINNIWRYENQNFNAHRIAERATKLYDKLRLFIDDINTIGHCLDKAQISYCLAKNKLFSGRGNIFSQAEKFRTMGVDIKKPIVFTSNTDKNKFFNDTDSNTSKSE